MSADPRTGLRPASSGAAPPAPRRGVARPARGARDQRRRPAGRRSSTSGAAPAGSRSGSPSSATGSWSSTPAPTPWPSSTVAPTRAGSPTGSPGARATSATLPDLVAAGSADVVLCHGVLEIVDDPAAALAALAAGAAPRRARSACWSTSGTPPWSPGRWPATSPQARALLDGSAGPDRLPGTAGSPPTRSPRCSTRPGSTAAPCTRSGCSSTWCPARWSTSSPARPQALVELERAVADAARVPRPGHPDPRPRHPPLSTRRLSPRREPSAAAGSA